MYNVSFFPQHQFIWYALGVSVTLKNWFYKASFIYKPVARFFNYSCIKGLNLAGLQYPYPYPYPYLSGYEILYL